MILEVSKLTKKYRNQRGIDNISFSLNKGDIYGLLGANGAGKTTAMKCMTGLCIGESERIMINGYDTKTHFEEAMQSVGCMVGNPDVYRHLTAYQNMKIVSRFHPSIPLSRIDEVLELVGLANNKKEKAKTFSTGMKQRLAFAMAIYAKPSLLILDEPTNGLDIDGKLQFNQLMKNLMEESETAILISSHLILDMQKLCTRVGIITSGKLIAEEYMSEIESLEDFYIEKTRGSGNSGKHPE